MTDEKRMRALWLAHILADYGKNAAGGDDTPQQQRFGADCVEAAALLIEAFDLSWAGDVSEPSLYNTAGIMRRNADKIEKARQESRVKYGYELEP
jgi:hypothetical protein